MNSIHTGNKCIHTWKCKYNLAQFDKRSRNTNWYNIYIYIYPPPCRGGTQGVFNPMPNSASLLGRRGSKILSFRGNHPPVKNSLPISLRICALLGILGLHSEGLLGPFGSKMEVRKKAEQSSAGRNLMDLLAPKEEALRPPSSSASCRI